MKKLIALLCVGLAVGAVAEVEYGYFYRTTGNDPWTPTSISLNEGDRLVILNSSYNAGAAHQIRIELNYGDGAISTEYYFVRYGITSVSGYAVAYSPEDARTIIGPCDLSPASDSSNGRAVRYKIIRPDAVVNTSPMNIISLPDDNNGDVELLVESSSDLQTWTPVYSGSAGTSNDAAFFRTRLIQN